VQHRRLTTAHLTKPQRVALLQLVRDARALSGGTASPNTAPIAATAEPTPEPTAEPPAEASGEPTGECAAGQTTELVRVHASARALALELGVSVHRLAELARQPGGFAGLGAEDPVAAVAEAAGEAAAVVAAALEPAVAPVQPVQVLYRSQARVLLVGSGTGENRHLNREFP
jgi:pyruvate/2-oxoglutarate dehydrogenase complex dihydrolipoamide acyltransferase (E2) component